MDGSTAAGQASLSSTISQSLLKSMPIELVMLCNHLILCHPLFLLPSIFPSIRGFSNELAPCIRWPKYWSFSLSISPSHEHSGLISFRIEWFALLAVQGTPENPLQYHSLKASILQCSTFFTTQLSHLYIKLLLNCISQTVATGSEGNPDPLNFIDFYTISANPQHLPLSYWFLANSSLFDMLLKNFLKSLYKRIVTPLPMDHGNLAITKEGTSAYTTWCYIQNHLCLDFGLERMVVLIILTAESLW